jgi:hypothetical protein
MHWIFAMLAPPPGGPGPRIDSPAMIRASRSCRTGAGMVGDDSINSACQDRRPNISG